HWARGERTAGPLLVLSMRNWMPVASVALAISPPRASISRTICPLASPPIAGLQDMRPVASTLRVRTSVERPIRAQARAASIPAWPAPTTITSCIAGIVAGNPKSKIPNPNIGPPYRPPGGGTGGANPLGFRIWDFRSGGLGLGGIALDDLRPLGGHELGHDRFQVGHGDPDLLHR